MPIDSSNLKHAVYVDETLKTLVDNKEMAGHLVDLYYDDEAGKEIKAVDITTGEITHKQPNPYNKE